MAKKVESIIDFGNGAIQERIQLELGKILENIQDINTDLKARNLSISFKIIPSNDRKSFQAYTSITKKLRPVSEVPIVAQLGMINGSVSLMENTGIPDGQSDIFGEIHTTKYIDLGIKN